MYWLYALKYFVSQNADRNDPEIENELEKFQMSEQLPDYLPFFFNGSLAVKFLSLPYLGLSSGIWLILNCYQI